ncbi:MAG TPA: PEGA domain-containing protein [Methanocorpusculum sp.]|nr:PEGA domain-containing protein [Methanocorpusculum sp.]
MKKAFIAILAVAAVVFGLFAGAAAADGMAGGNTLKIYVSSTPSGATATYLATGESLVTPGYFTFHSGTLDWGTGSTIKVEKEGYLTDTSIYVSSNDFDAASYAKETTISKSVTLVKVQTDGYIYVSSDPSGASIRIDGSYYGTTPRSISVPAGYHTVSVAKDGYSGYTKQVYVNSGATTDVHATLSKVVSTGYLSANSYPKYADVYVDGSYQGQTPITVALDSGTHSVLFRKSGYSDYTISVRINEGETSIITASLTQKETSGYVSIASSPGGASVYIDGNFVGNTPYSTGSTTSYLSAGPYSTSAYHSLELRLPGYNTYATSFKPLEKSTITVSATLSPATPTTASLTVTSSPSGASVYVDNVYYGISPVTVSSLQVGSHSIKVSALGYQDSVNTISVSAGQSVSLPVTLIPTSPAPVSSPAPFIGILAGLGAAALFFAARRH